jgi:hypothetical protein
MVNEQPLADLCRWMDFDAAQKPPDFGYASPQQMLVVPPQKVPQAMERHRPHAGIEQGDLHQRACRWIALLDGPQGIDKGGHTESLDKTTSYSAVT